MTKENSSNPLNEKFRILNKVVSLWLLFPSPVLFIATCQDSHALFKLCAYVMLCSQQLVPQAIQKHNPNVV